MKVGERNEGDHSVYALHVFKCFKVCFASALFKINKVTPGYTDPYTVAYRECKK